MSLGMLRSDGTALVRAIDTKRDLPDARTCQPLDRRIHGAFEVTVLLRFYLVPPLAVTVTALTPSIANGFADNEMAIQLRPKTRRVGNCAGSGAWTLFQALFCIECGGFKCIQREKLQKPRSR